MRSRVIMKKNLGSTFVVIYGFLALSVAVDSADAEVPEPFQGFDDTSRYSVNYDDLTDLLSTVVLDKGRSNRRIPKQPPNITGTYMKARVKKSANEGNRFFYEAFKDDEEARQLLRDMQISLLQIPESRPLEQFSRDEQLAYWLNLYNVTVLNEVVAVYPKRSLKSLIKGRRSVFSKKLLTVAGRSLSLDDIQLTILKQNYDSNPLIIYGLYQGIVGGPNVRTSAYTGADVYAALADNAYEFVNSNRGTYGWDKGIFRVSSFYDRNKAYFPDFDAELSQHLLQYLQGSLRARLENASTLKPDINDWTVTDMGATRQDSFGGSLAPNPSAMLDSYKSERRVNGSYTVASVMVKRKREKPQDDTITMEDIGRLPGERQGASIEEIAAEQPEPPE
jgi:hypothetical protein